MIFSLTFSIKDISMFLTFWFCLDWEFRSLKTQALVYSKDVASVQAVAG
jgi:hypothetical protein